MFGWQKEGMESQSTLLEKFVVAFEGIDMDAFKCEDFRGRCPLIPELLSTRQDILRPYV